MRNNKSEAYKQAIKIAKRMTITMLCCIPVLIVFAYLMRNIIKSDVVQIICFMVILALAIGIEELIYNQRQKKKQAKQLLEKNKDVFK